MTKQKDFSRNNIELVSVYHNFDSGEELFWSLTSSESTYSLSLWKT